MTTLPHDTTKEKALESKFDPEAIQSSNGSAT